MPDKEILFEKIDNALLGQYEQINKSSLYQKVIDVFSSLTDSEQKIVNTVASIVAITLPILIIILLFFSNYSIKNNVSEQEETIREINAYLQNKQELSIINKSFVTHSTLDTKSKLQSKLKSILRLNNINLSSLKIKDFDLSDNNSKMSDIRSLLEFKKFTTIELTNFLKRVLSNENMRVNKLKITKNKKQNLLNGNIEISYFTNK